MKRFYNEELYSILIEADPNAFYEIDIPSYKWFIFDCIDKLFWWSNRRVRRRIRRIK